ncbi:hypothetical protein C4566_01820 [Candidatus Parcubacteria bacterium]|nr:MAG: hypothetical protein C4566_01820 [Candidatus Parcubacteria bacterium]
MKNKKTTLVLILAIILTGVSLVYISPVEASDQMIFKPSVEIPGMGEFLQQNEGGGYIINSNTLGNYISAVYTYAARFVSVLGMLMLVIAGWQWLFAAGSADKINNAKQTINGVLIGMILLLGGQLLLSQISVNLVKFTSLDIRSNIFTNSAPINSCEGVRQSNPGQTCGAEVVLSADVEQTEICLMWGCAANEGQCLIIGTAFTGGSFVDYCPSTKAELEQKRMSANYNGTCDCYTNEELVLMNLAR